MVADFEEGQILKEINDLEEEINLLETIKVYKEVDIALSVVTIDVWQLNRTIARLQRDKEHQERRLQIHRQRRAESGVKY